MRCKKGGRITIVPVPSGSTEGGKMAAGRNILISCLIVGGTSAAIRGCYNNVLRPKLDETSYSNSDLSSGHSSGPTTSFALPPPPTVTWTVPLAAELRWSVGNCVYGRNLDGSVSDRIAPIECAKTHLGKIIADAPNDQACPWQADSFAEHFGGVYCIDEDQ